jgi:sulfhydrogenase subunit beta (sulfur reductase)
MAPSPQLLPKSRLQDLIASLEARGFRVVGPVARDGAVVWDTVRQASDLPWGWRDRQEPGRYRLEQSGEPTVFGVVHGPQSLKPFVFAPREGLLVIEKAKSGFAARPTIPQAEKVAVLGARACDLAGLAVQDRIFLKDLYPDPYYEARRRALFVVAVNCTRALSTCFCASMNTGPRAEQGFDLVLTESSEHFVLETGSDEGRAVAEELAPVPAPQGALAEVDARIAACAHSQTRRLDRASLPQALYEAHEHPRWDQVAARCLACANCTMVCPTCFCHTVEVTPDLDRQRTEHVRLWDSCFTPDHGYVHGKNLRPAVKDRYRMWLTHKLASWTDQFGMSGCVGCGRCITWCPVGIDLTEEMAALTEGGTRNAERGTPDDER